MSCSSFPSFCLVSFLAGRAGAVSCHPVESEGHLFAVVGFAAVVPSGFATRCAQLCGCPLQGGVVASGLSAVWVPVSSGGVQWFWCSGSRRLVPLAAS
ncbi:MAG: hypothetical protein AAF316_04480 [Cyanobacteria bacterium P01_A01_bin.80]